LLTVAIFGGIVLGLLATKPDVEIIYTTIALSVFVHSVAEIIFIFWYIRLKRYPVSSIGLNRPSKKILHVLWQIPVLVIGLVLVQIIVFAVLKPATPASAGATGELFDVVPLYAAVLLAIATSILVPVWEEILFRGVIFNRLRQYTKLTYAFIVSAAIFGLAHMAPILFPYLFTMGLAWAWLYHFHKTLWASIIGHAFVNSLVTIPILLVLFV
jgi:membrane protease YdiL (CAAX protease family)